MRAQAPLQLPSVSVMSTRVAIQDPVATFAMPVSALRYEPLVDLQARNLTEGQADLTVRGGIFEGTGVRVGATTTIDPQTGHYLAELPVAPAMLTEARVVTGAALVLDALNATAGGLVYDWRPIRNGGFVRVGAGEFRTHREEFYQGFADLATWAGAKVSADVDVAHSGSAGAVPFGEHRFDRANLRLQRSGSAGQTDLFAGYQAKFFGWPNLYTPFNSNETEDLETTLFVLNHRRNFGGGDFLEGGVSHRRNKDDYAFNRFAPVGPVHPFQHTTWVDGVAIGGRRRVGETTWNFRTEVLRDELKSTSLIFGRFTSRTIYKMAVTAERSWRVGRGRVALKGGGVYDDSNRDASAVSPMVEISRTWTESGGPEVYAAFSRTTQLPTYTALNSNPAAGLFRGNPNLGRQFSRNLELGIRGASAGWVGQAAIFWRQDDSQVDWTYRRGVTARTANPVDIGVTGLELMARRSWRSVELVIGYTALTKNPDYRGASVDASFYALNYARHRLTAAVTVQLEHGFELRMDNVARLQAANPLRTSGGDDAVISSFAMTYRPPAFNAVEFSAGQENVWNSSFQEVPAVPPMPRRWSAGMAYRW